MSYRASAPGSLMLLGEYAVLYGKQALVCAVNKRITVTLTPRMDDQIHIQSGLFGDYKTSLSALMVEKPYPFILAALYHHQSRLKRGCDIEVSSNFSDQVGLGSSAAVTVAMLAVLIAWLGIRSSLLDLTHQARQVIRSVQGIGSGADAAAAVHGGIVGYQPHPLVVEKFSVNCPLTVLYAGFKTPTVEAIKHVQQQFTGHPHIFRSLMQSIGQCAVDAMPWVRKSEWVQVGEIMTMQQGLMQALGVNTPILEQLIATLRDASGMLGAKISGSGLGDCVVGLGKSIMHPAAIPLEITLQGVHCDRV